MWAQRQGNQAQSTPAPFRQPVLPGSLPSVRPSVLQDHWDCSCLAPPRESQRLRGQAACPERAGWLRRVLGGPHAAAAQGLQQTQTWELRTHAPPQANKPKPSDDRSADEPHSPSAASSTQAERRAQGSGFRGRIGCGQLSIHRGQAQGET